MRLRVICLVAILVVGASSVGSGQNPYAMKRRKVMKTEEQWSKSLSHLEYLVLRTKATEPAFGGRYWDNHARGYYTCAGCGAFLFASNAKFDSGTGWPSFFQPLARDRVENAPDNEGGEPRIEVMCSDCGGHLGHVFNDGPPPTGLRYCINSVSLKFLTEAQAKAVLAKRKAREDRETKAKEAEEKKDQPKGARGAETPAAAPATKSEAAPG